jgi:uncharacterized protein (TIGR03437 family)
MFMRKHSPSVLLAWLALCPVPAALAQIPTISAIVSSTNFRSLHAPGSLSVIFGSNFGSTATGLSVQVGGKPAAILAVQPSAINIQMPVELPTGTHAVVVNRQGQASAPFGITLDSYAPALFVRDPGPLLQNPLAIGEGSFLGSDNRDITKDKPALPGEEIWVIASGLGATQPVVPTGTPGPQNPAANTLTIPRVTVAGQQVLVSISIIFPGQVGTYIVRITVPPGLPEGAPQVKLEIGGRESNTVTLLVGKPAAPLPQISAIVNGASFGSAGVAATGSFVTVFGLNFGSKDKLSGFPATDFEGVSVTFNGTPAPLFALFGSPQNQINLVTPNELPESGDVTVQVKTPAGTSPNYAVKMSAAVPGIFLIPDLSNRARRNAAALFANTAWRVMPQAQAVAFVGWPSSCAGLNAAAVCGQPAAPGDNIQIYVTGLGKATPGGAPGGRPLATGSVAPADGNPLYLTVQNPVITVGDVPAQLQFSGLAPGFAGLYQVNFQIPPSAPTGDDVAVKILMPNGSSDTATIAIRK